MKTLGFRFGIPRKSHFLSFGILLVAFVILSQAAHGQITDTQSLIIAGSATTTQPSTFTVNVNNFSKSVTYCLCVVGGQQTDEAPKLVQALVTAINADSTSPVNAAVGPGFGGNTAVLALTAKTAGTLLAITSSDDGAVQSGVAGNNFLGIVVEPSQNTARFTIVGGTNGSQGPSTFTVNVNGFSKSVSYCDCVIGGQIVDTPIALMQAVVNAFNSDSSSPVSASLSSTQVTLTAKTSGTVLTVTSSDDSAGLGGLGAFNFLEIPVVPALDSATLTIVGSTASPSPSTFTVNVNGFSKSVTYCNCVVGSQFIAESSQLMQAVVNAFNSDASSPVKAFAGTGAANDAVLTLTAKTTGTILNIISSDDGAGSNGGTGLAGFNFLATSGIAPLTGVGDPGSIALKYVVLSVIYAPPGALSSVDYGNSTVLGTSTQATKSFSDKTSLTVTAEGGLFGDKGSATQSTSFTQASDDSHSVSVTKTTNNDIIYPGPLNSNDGIDHDQDVILVWLNPLANFLATGPNLGNPGTWTGYSFDTADPTNEVDVIALYVAWLKNPSLITDPDILNRLARTWAQPLSDGSSPAITTTGPNSDFAQILARDPFSNPNYVVTVPPGGNVSTDNRFDLVVGNNFNYEPPPAGGQPGTQKFSVNYNQTTANGLTATDTYTLGFSLKDTTGVSIPWFNASLSFVASTELTWTSKTQRTFTQGSNQLAAVSITGPNSDYTGSTNVQVFKDNIYGTFMFNFVTEPTFELAASPASNAVSPSGSASYTISTSAVNGFTGTITFSSVVSGLPAGATASISPSSVGTPGSATLTVNTSSSTPPGSYVLTISGSAPIPGATYTDTRDIKVTLVVEGFSVQVTPSSQSVNAGQSTSYTVSTTATTGFTDQITFSVSGLPANATASFNPAGIVGSGTSTMTVTTTSATPSGNSMVTVTGTIPGLTHSAPPVNLTVIGPDFTVAVTPSSMSIIPGECASYTVSTTSLNGFSGVISLSQSGAPSGASVTFNPLSITGAGSSTLTVCAPTSTPAGSYTINVTGISGNINHSTPVDLVVQDFNLSATPSSQTIQAGAGTSYMVSTTTLDGFSRAVTLGVSGLPSGASATFNPISITGAGSSTLTVTTSTSTPAGTYTLTISGGTPINGTSSTLSRSTTVTLVVVGPDFTIGAAPASMTITGGGTANYTVTIGALNGFSGSVNLSVTGNPAHTKATFTPTSVTGSGTSTLKITSQSNAPKGTFMLTIKGTSGTLSRSTFVTLIIQ